MSECPYCHERTKPLFSDVFGDIELTYMTPHDGWCVQGRTDTEYYVAARIKYCPMCGRDLRKADE